jgi:hypothetical protein
MFAVYNRLGFVGPQREVFVVEQAELAGNGVHVPSLTRLLFEAEGKRPILARTAIANQEIILIAAERNGVVQLALPLERPVKRLQNP